VPVLLSVENVTKSYGGLKAVNGVSLQVQPGELVGLIGPNGSGKTTLINMITGTERVTSGRVEFNGSDITKLPAFVRASMGISRTFQIVKPLTSMTVWENVLVASAFGNSSTHLWPSVKASVSAGHIRESAQDVDGILKRVGLAQKCLVLAGQLGLPDRKKLELARALAMKPRLLLLDEVMAGLNATEIEETMRLIRQINEEGITVICIEHVMKAIMSISRRVVVLQEGRLIADGSPKDIVNSEVVIKAYLGARYVRRSGQVAGEAGC
jgi:branched-chain amino acid transport system ATP-binding protein